MGVEENVLSAGFKRTREMYRESVVERRGLFDEGGGEVEGEGAATAETRATNHHCIFRVSRIHLLTQKMTSQTHEHVVRW
jgi:hypothetical protein